MTLLILVAIFLATLVANVLSVVYQRLVLKDQHLKATTVSVVLAGISLLIWKHCLTEPDSVPAIVSYLIGDAVGTYTGFKVRLEPKT
jgi:uncharacterized protein YebE (UPF0316 family)